MPMRFDLHQHLWTPQLIERLAARTRLPSVDAQPGTTTLHADGEQPYLIDAGANDPAARLQQADRDGVDRIVVALSSPIGIEALPRTEATELIDAHLSGLAELSSRFAAWGPLALSDLDAGDVERLLARGCVGLSVPAPALAGPARVHELGPVLEEIVRAGVPLFVHPGRPVIPWPGEGEPLWWRPVVDYVSQMQAAWLTFVAEVRRLHPDLVVVFAMLAGMAPLQLERLALRGGPAVSINDPLTFYDTSGYGPRAVEAMAGLVGRSQLVYGSDRPVVDPVRQDLETVLQLQAAELFASVPRRAVA